MNFCPCSTIEYRKVSTSSGKIAVMPAKKDSGSGKMTKEEERLLLESSRQVSGTASALFYGNAFIVSALPVCE